MRGKQKKLFTSKHQLKPGDYIVTKRKKAYEVVDVDKCSKPVKGDKWVIQTLG
jgi:Ribonuclease G/E